MKRCAAGLEADPARQDARGQAHVEGAEDVAPAQRRQERGLGQGGGQDAHRLGRHLARLGVGRTAGHDHDALAVGVRGQQAGGRVSSCVGRTAAPRGARRARSPPRRRRVSARAITARRPGGVRSEAAASAVSAVGAGRDLDQLRVAAHHGLAQAQEEDRQLLAQVAGQRHQHRRRARLVDGGPGQAEHQLGREAVAQLGVDRVGADRRPWPAWPRRRRTSLVRRAPPMTATAPGAAGALGRGEPGRGGRQRLAPADRDQLALLADARLDEAAVLEAARLAGLAEELAAARAEADHLGRRGGRHVDGLVGHLGRRRAVVDLVAVDRLEGEAALVAQPAVVHRLRVDAEQPGQAVLRRLHGHPAADRAGGAGGLDLVEVPGAGREAVGRRGSAPTGQICTVLPLK